MKALVTGANGFVGSHMVTYLMDQGLETRAMVRQTSDLTVLKLLNENREVNLVYGDVTDPASLTTCFKDLDYIFHVAGLIKSPTWEGYAKVNAEGTRNVCEAAEVAPNLKRLVLVSSMAAGGPTKVGERFTEDMPSNPVTMYGQSKLQGEQEALKFKDKLPLTIIRPPIIYGPGDYSTLEVFQPAKMGIVMSIRGAAKELSSIPVLELCEACYLAAQKDESRNEIFNACSDEIVSWEKFGDLTAEALGKKPFHIRLPAFLLPPMAYLSELAGKLKGEYPIFNRHKVPEALAEGWACDNSKAKRLLGWTPKTSLKDGLKEAASWYLEKGWL